MASLLRLWWAAAMVVTVAACSGTAVDTGPGPVVERYFAAAVERDYGGQYDTVLPALVQGVSRDEFVSCLTDAEAGVPSTLIEDYSVETTDPYDLHGVTVVDVEFSIETAFGPTTERFPVPVTRADGRWWIGDRSGAGGSSVADCYSR